MNLILFSALAGVVMMLGGLAVKQKQQVSWMAGILMGVLLVLNTLEMNGITVVKFNLHGMLAVDHFGLLINEILLAAGCIYLLLQSRDIENVGDDVADYYALIFFVFCGIGIATSYTTLLMLFLGIEIISIPLYILTGSAKSNLKSNEAALKYFLMGSFSTGLMLMGIALIYGATGSFQVGSIAALAATDPATGFATAGQTEIYRAMAGLILLLVSMSFKVSAAPFHFWTPDVYDGAPTPFTSFMATIVKAAAFVAFIKVFSGGNSNVLARWQVLIAIIITCTLLIGNITAVFQQSVKRMLAYSSIAQAGFMLFALFSFTTMSKEAMVLYAAAYCIATIGIFAILNRLDDYTYDGFNGFAKKEPLLAALNTIFFLSLAGIPLTAGFFGKYFMIASALQGGGKFLWMFIIAMICAAISVYYYFRVIQAMYFKSGEGQVIGASPLFKVVLTGVAVLVILIGVFPQWLLQWMYF